MSLTTWSMQHICEIFEAKSDEEAIKALERTFSKDLEASINGKNIPFCALEDMVLALRKGSKLKVVWHQAKEISMPLNSFPELGGSFSGMYAIQGIKRVLPGSSYPVEFERHKTVHVEIAPEKHGDSLQDTLRIVKLTCTATDIRIPRQASL